MRRRRCRWACRPLPRRCWRSSRPRHAHTDRTHAGACCIAAAPWARARSAALQLPGVACGRRRGRVRPARVCSFTPVPQLSLFGRPADAARPGAGAQPEVNYMDLPTPIKYEEIQREAMSARPRLWRHTQPGCPKPCYACARAPRRRCRARTRHARAHALRRRERRLAACTPGAPGIALVGAQHLRARAPHRRSRKRATACAHNAHASRRSSALCPPQCR
jgi:hypothetical protein